MAARRISKSAIDWAAFSERVPANQKTNFQAFKIKSDSYLSRVLALPENPPPIDWSKYRSTVVVPGLVDTFEKEYSAVKVPYPTTNLISDIDNQEKEADREIADFVKASNSKIAEYKAELEKWSKIIPFEHMTMEDYRDAFPQYAYDTWNRPTLWPHNPEEQPDYKDDSAKSGGH